MALFVIALALALAGATRYSEGACYAVLICGFVGVATATVGFSGWWESRERVEYVYVRVVRFMPSEEERKVFEEERESGSGEENG